MNKSLIASAALLFTATLSAATANAQTTTAAATAPADTLVPYSSDHHGRGHHHSPFMGALKQLNLSDAQKASIHQIFATQHASAKAEHVDFRARHRAFEALDPSAPDYQQQVNGYADEAAAQARSRTQGLAQIKTQVIAVLTPEQKTQFLAALANPPQHARFAPPAG